MLVAAMTASCRRMDGFYGHACNLTGRIIEHTKAFGILRKLHHERVEHTYYLTDGMRTIAL